MYELFKRLALRFLKVPPEPHAPYGSEGSLKVFRAASGYYRYRLISWLIGQSILVLTLLGVTAALVAGSLAPNAPGALKVALLAGVGLLWLVYAVWAFLGYATLRLDYEMRWYKVTDRSLRIREGVFHVREITMTFANIQNIAVTQGPLQRYFGIADLEVKNAGGGAMAAQQQQQGTTGILHGGVFRGVDNAEEIRGMMLDRLKRYKDAGLGEAGGHAPQHEGQHEGLGAEASAEVVEVVKAMRDESRAMREAAQRLARG